MKGKHGKHHGQADAEKASRLVNPEYRRQRREQVKREDERYDSLCGPVEVRRVEPK